LLGGEEKRKEERGEVALFSPSPFSDCRLDGRGRGGKVRGQERGEGGGTRQLVPFSSIIRFIETTVGGREKRIALMRGEKKKKLVITST